MLRSAFIVILLWLMAGQAQSPALIETCFGVLAIVSAVFFLVVLTAMRRAGFAAMVARPRSGAAETPGQR